jgi:hypothetical protein
MAGRQGLEPRYADPESAVLPLDDLPRDPSGSITTVRATDAKVLNSAIAGRVHLMSLRAVEGFRLTSLAQ